MTFAAILAVRFRKFPFLIGKVLTSKADTMQVNSDGITITFPFLIGKVLTLLKEQK